MLITDVSFSEREGNELRGRKRGSGERKWRGRGQHDGQLPEQEDDDDDGHAQPAQLLLQQQLDERQQHEQQSSGQRKPLVGHFQSAHRSPDGHHFGPSRFQSLYFPSQEVTGTSSSTFITTTTSRSNRT